MSIDHSAWMKQALLQAEKAFAAEEVPVGAIVVLNGKVIGRGHNQKEQFNDPTAHAEMIAITAAANTLGDWRLNDCDMYVTLEPCAMCAGAIVKSRLRNIFFGAYNQQDGCVSSLYNICNDPRFKTKIAVKGGVLENDSLSLIQDFFKVRRKNI